MIDSEVGGMRTLAARLLSAAGAWAYAVGGRVPIPFLSRWSVVPIVVCAALFCVGAVAIDYGRVAFTDPDPVVATVQQMAAGTVPGARGWVTVSGTLQPELKERRLRNGVDYLYVLTDADGVTSILVHSNRGLGFSGGPVTLTGLVRGHTQLSFAYSWTYSEWTSWARTTFPSLKVADDVYLAADESPAWVLLVPLGLGIWLVALWVLIGCLAGYVVFIRSNAVQPPSGVGHPNSSATVRISGTMPARLHTLFRLRETKAVIRHVHAAGGPGSIAIVREGHGPTNIELSSIREACPGSTFPWRGRRAAVRLVSRAGSLVISFDTEAARDSWLLFIDHSTAPGERHDATSSAKAPRRHRKPVARPVERR